jgi:hypothetical protein
VVSAARPVAVVLAHTVPPAHVRVVLAQASAPQPGNRKTLGCDAPSALPGHVAGKSAAPGWAMTSQSTSARPRIYLALHPSRRGVVFPSSRPAREFLARWLHES